MPKIIRLLQISSFLIISVLMNWAGAGETRYITDQFKIPLRTGDSASHRILRTLKSGTPVELLDTNPDTGYARIRTSDGAIGFVFGYELMNEPSARDRLTEIDTKMQTSQTEAAKLAEQLNNVQGKYRKLQEDNTHLQSVAVRLEQELEGIKRTSASAVQIANERNELRKSVISLIRQVEELKQQNLDKDSETAQRWFLIGGGMVLIGILLGLVLPHLRFQRRRSSWGSL